METFLYICLGSAIEHFTGIFGKLLEITIDYIKRKIK